MILKEIQILSFIFLTSCTTITYKDNCVELTCTTVLSDNILEKVDFETKCGNKLDIHGVHSVKSENAKAVSEGAAKGVIKGLKGF